MARAKLRLCTISRTRPTSAMTATTRMPAVGSWTPGRWVPSGSPRSTSCPAGVLMDRVTLLGHQEHWVTEPSPTAGALVRRDRAESALYADLISNAYGPSVRLEQERVSFSAVEKAIVAQPTVVPGSYGWK